MKWLSIAAIGTAFAAGTAHAETFGDLTKLYDEAVAFENTCRAQKGADVSACYERRRAVIQIKEGVHDLFRRRLQYLCTVGAEKTELCLVITHSQAPAATSLSKEEEDIYRVAQKIFDQTKQKYK